MCGIAGFVDQGTRSEARETAVLRMCEAMLHRGPDDSGVASIGPATIGMRRLAIFDPANGHQPMVTPDGRYTLVFNGAIYNHRELRHDLEPTGFVFRTHCDTEVLLAALVHWGEAALGRLRGMFAFALWDSFDQSLFAARDPFGIKPLYYRHDAGRFLFASEVSALLASGVVPAEVDPESVAEYLAWFAVPAPRTIYRGVRSLQPGELLRFRRGRLDVRPGWTFKGIPEDPLPCRTRDDLVRALRQRLNDTIRAHMLADVPVGAFLSGGLDSAAIVGLMARASGRAIKTFSIGFKEEAYSEAAEAEATARHLGTDHRTRIISGSEVARDLESFLRTCDQPTGDGINTFYASQAAQAGGVKVALSGLGGDELFGGYPSFRAVPRLVRRLPLWRRVPSAFRALATGALGKGGARPRKLSDLLRHARDSHEVAALQRRVFSEARQRSLLSGDALAAIGSPAPFHPRLGALRDELGSPELFSLVSAWELRTYMADVLLRDSDVMSMRHSLELRVPFVDRPLVEWLWRQPARLRDDPRRPKSILAEAAADVLPPLIGERPKRGFTLPFPVWMRRELRPFLSDTFAPASIGRTGLFASGSVRKVWDGFAGGGEDRDWSRVWSLAVLIAFVNQRRPEPAPSAAATH
jgi:asparagine synthase (glutamine-hydrolysing)